MARPKRVFAPHGIYHVTSRGSDRRPLWVSTTDWDVFRDRFAATVIAYELECIGLCQMPNHYHAVVRTPDARLSDALRDLHGGYSRLYSRVYGADAHLFRNRFHAELIEGDAHLLAALRYIHLNPVRARLCRRPAEWHWSTYRATVGLEACPLYLAPGALLALLGDDLGAAKDRYRRFVEHGLDGASRSVVAA